MHKMETSPHEKPEKAFDALWKKSLDSGKIQPRTLKGRLYYALNFPSRIFSKQRLLIKMVENEIAATHGQIAGLKILEPGSGTGVITTQLSYSGADVHLLDLSASALMLSKKIPCYKNNRKLIHASMFDMPFVDETFDVLWNEGVLEHFSEEQQVAALSEYSRVLKKGGLMVLVVPKEGAPFYLAGANRAREAGIWRYGNEKPMSTLKNLAIQVRDLKVLKEYSFGLILETQFLSYFFSAAGLIRLQQIYDLLNGWMNMILWPLNKLPGSLLVSVLIKE